MRTRTLAFLILCFAGCYGYAQLRTETKAKVALDEAASRHQPVAAAAPVPLTKSEPAARVDFATQIKPLLDPKCQPCHFNGGKVYATMPFDRPQTIKTLGTKLFTRIKDENERQLIREFLAQP
jgi:hypothetical protein